VLEIKSVSKTFSSGAVANQAIANVSFKVSSNEFVCVVGPSGCGKTTLLKCMSGLLPTTSGRIELNGAVVNTPPPEMAMVFQDYSRSLFPWSTVGRNVLLPLRRKALTKGEKADRVARALEAVGLEAFINYYPWQLSGGMQQRVAIARALAYQPQILLMDEPFASVDAQTRAELEDLILEVRGRIGKTILLVTHDIDESVYLSDRIVVLTGSPTWVKEIIRVDLPQPRDQIETKKLSEFADLRARVYRLINQSARAMSRAKGALKAPI
jgi:NitT/TauT family transport system ATP-binding protein